jgi:hypothetical protein
LKQPQRSHGISVKNIYCHILPDNQQGEQAANVLSLILRRLDEIERKLDRMLDELRTPTAIGYSARRGNRPSKD